MKTHHLKCWPEFFEAVIEGRKPFEVRVNDRDYEEGDLLMLEEYNQSTNEYTGRKTARAISYILPIGIMPGFHYSDNDHVVIGLRDPNDGWIPCSERLPTEDDVYGRVEFEVTVQSGEDRYVTTGFYTEEQLWEDAKGNVIFYPVAYRPMPEPWKGEE